MMAPQLPGGIALSTLLEDIVAVPARHERAVLDITLDSRDVGPGSCFLALAGSTDDGTKYVGEAIVRGAAAVVAERPMVSPRADIPLLHTPVLRAQLGAIANRFFATPSAAMKLFAVTGTNGKTSVAHLLAQAVRLRGTHCGYIGTLGAGEPGGLTLLANTTPDVIALNRWLARFTTAGLNVTTLEVSSHALAQKRLAGLELYAAAFTNLGHDHLDYHADLKAYGDCKQSLFEHDGLRAAVVNIDDALGADIAASMRPGIEVWTCSSGHGRGAPAHHARLTVDAITTAPDGMRFTLRADGNSAEVQSALPGRFNVDNLLAVAGLMLSGGYAFDAVCSSLAGLQPVPGRMQDCGRTASGARIYVDYAHSPDSLAAVLGALRELRPRRLLVVFGCGGERDRSKRPLMGEIAERCADQVIVTTDNPRGEEPETIAAEILVGMQAPTSASVIHDRRLAIRTAVENAAAGDIVVVAGKGHETTQERCGRRIAFSDQDEIRCALGAPG